MLTHHISAVEEKTCSIEGISAFFRTCGGMSRCTVENKLHAVNSPKSDLCYIGSVHVNHGCKIIVVEGSRLLKQHFASAQLLVRCSDHIYLYVAQTVTHLLNGKSRHNTGHARCTVTAAVADFWQCIIFCQKSRLFLSFRIDNSPECSRYTAIWILNLNAVCTQQLHYFT